MENGKWFPAPYRLSDGLSAVAAAARALNPYSIPRPYRLFGGLRAVPPAPRVLNPYSIASPHFPAALRADLLFFPIANNVRHTGLSTVAALQSIRSAFSSIR